MKSTVVLALDIGTSSTRAAIYDARGDRLVETTAQVEYPLHAGTDGKAELDPRDIARAAERVIAASLAAWRKLGRREEIAGIGVSCFWHSLLGLDAQGKPLTPIYTWADSRCRREAEALRKNRAEEISHARTGCMTRTSFWPPKLRWLRRAEPRLFRAVSHWVSPAEYIQQQWCGAASASLSMASGTGLLNGHTLRWDAPQLRRAGIQLSQLSPLSDAPLKIAAARARKFPELAGARWFAAIGDGAASNLGSGAVAPGIAAINVGTSAALRVVVRAGANEKKLLAPFGLFAYRVDSARRLVGGAVSNAGNLRAWALRELKLPADLAEQEKLLAARTTPAPGLTLLPFWIAERAPTWPEAVPSAVVGITQATGALDILQALQEATYHRLAQIADGVEKAAGRRLTFIVSGGIQRSASALQRLANVLGRPVYASSEPEASLRGAACFALEGLGLKPAAPKLGRLIRPQVASARAYADARVRQTELEALFRGSRFPLSSR